MLITLFAVFVLALITVREFADTVDKLARILLFVMLAPFVIGYSFLVPYESKY